MLMLFCSATTAQSSDAAAKDSSKSIKPFSAVWRSLIIPGWGQVYQERLLEGVILYGGAWVTYSKTFNAYLSYRNNRSDENLQSLKNNAAMAGFFYVLNLADIFDTAYRLRPKGWQGALLSDKPLKSPWGAAMRSAIIPGLGQVYTENYWMAGIYFSGCAFLTYKVYDANQKYQSTGETKYKDQRSDYSWYLGAGYMITMIDAYVNAYLYRFDDMMRLTVTPVIYPKGAGVSFNVVF
jgi:hypothetical protein